MSNTSTVALADIMATKSGSVDPSKYPDEVFDLYSIPAFDVGQPDIVVGSSIGSAKQIVEPGDVLLSKIVPHIRRSWVVGQDRGRRLIASGEWIVFRAARVHARYLRHVLVGDPFHAQFMGTVSGVGGSLLRARPAHVAKIRVPLPPLPEQHRIAEVLDRAEALRAKRRAALDQLDTLTQSIFVDMFGDPATNPKGWPSSSLADLGAIHTGKTPPTKLPDMFGGDIPFATPGDLDGRLVTTERTLTRAGAEYGKVVRAGSALVGCIGNIGKMAKTPSPCAFNQQINAVEWGKNIEDDYGIAALAFTKSQMVARSSSTTVPILNKSGFSKVELCVPPVTLQRDFARRIAAAERLRASHRTSLTELDALFASLQHRAFRGEL